MTSYNPTNWPRCTRRSPVSQLTWRSKACRCLSYRAHALWAICECCANGLTACASSSSLVTSWCE